MPTNDSKAPASPGPREAITRAVEILMDRHRVTQAEAFEMLVQGSACSSEEVRATAGFVVAEASRDE